MGSSTELNNNSAHFPPCSSGAPQPCTAWNYTFKLVDWMAAHKMNYGVAVVLWEGTDSFYNVVPGFNDDTVKAGWIVSLLQELQAYMEERHVQFVPSVRSASANSLFPPLNIEGKWVQNASFVFDAARGVARPATPPAVMARQLNGGFEGLDPDGLPAGWTFAAPTFAAPTPPLRRRARGHDGATSSQWSTSTAVLPGTKSGTRALQCEMHEVECAVKGVRWANNRAVPRVAYDGPCGSEIASSPMVNVSGGSIVQVSVWAKLASYSGPSGQMPQITLMTFDKEGDHCLDAFYSGAGSILGGAKEAAWTFTAAWQEYRATISVQPNATHLSLYSALQCFGCPAGAAMNHAAVLRAGGALGGRARHEPPERDPDERHRHRGPADGRRRRGAAVRRGHRLHRRGADGGEQRGARGAVEGQPPAV
jgi:hypothetical protein